MPVFESVTVLGAGVLGAQIAFQTASHGIPVVSYDVSDDAIQAARRRLDAIVDQYVADSGREKRAGAEEALTRIRFSTDLAEAVSQAGLVIEAVPENVELKRSVYAQIAAAAPESTVFATNSSTLLPSAIADATGRPDRFLALHFANHIWRQNTAEIMGTPQTDPAVYQRVVAFAVEIGMVPIQLHKEQPGYVLNSLLVPLLNAGAELVLKGVAEPETVDATWRIGTGAPLGPFQIFDVVGLRTAYAIASARPDAGSQAWAAYLKEHYLDQGKLGVESGEGFYRYR
ncbi:3-hydroxyacyl-CoA dehydrogenase [Herbiconiux sp. VKM Ac-1786]|jgi:3-hydroxybutyryl-CoA dehydrogenase|uniref:3-hydroxyacyl-CoA dehydrogenase n=1 Tax=Herbiconiux sp. VKM Ac-1786 TaxID=2783824 RepID=UPI00188B7F42|nr:3-hydroxyacyl-CoA dehydrogenase [Herbiconiux sp. VKM Ac-1786]MBF4574356.1 3-hydroxyacyl-CoA dehydrogenase [Herbiconiux sp. VKM Ac-1786]